MCLVNNHQLKVSESLVARLSLAARQQRLLGGDDHLRRVVLFGVVVSHFDIGEPRCHNLDFVHGLPHQITHRTEDQRPAENAICEHREDHGLPCAGEQSIERGCASFLHGTEVFLDDKFLVVASVHASPVRKKTRGPGRRNSPGPLGAQNLEVGKLFFGRLGTTLAQQLHRLGV